MRCGIFSHKRIGWHIFNFILVVIIIAADLSSPNRNVINIERFQRGNHPRRYRRQVFFNGIGNGKQVTPSHRVSRIPRISSAELEKFVNRSVATVERRLGLLEQSIYANGIVLSPGNPSWFAAASAKTKVVAKNISKMALVAEEATRLLANQYKFNKDQILHALPTVDVRGTALERDCPLTVDFPCRPKKYRAYSGYCNNVQNPRWGNANTAYVRYLSPDYSNHVNNPRQSASGGPLPGARHVSAVVHSDSERPHPHLTVFLAIFAEFIFHDIFHTSQSAGYRGHRIRCCGVAKNFLHPECYPIIDDSITNKKNFCVNYVRSSNVPRAGCTLGPREQINQVTSFLDGSAIYGSSEEEVKRLRTYKNGLMKTQEGLELLPPDISNPHDCRASALNHKCFLAGDVRVNENVGLMVMHTLWVREHNRIARELFKINPHWTDDHLFEETRRIIGAVLQHVTYSELLPALLGNQVLRQFDLQPRDDSSFYHGYDINLNPGTSNAFAASKLQHVTYSELLPALLGNQVLRQFDLQPRDDSSFYHGYDINLNPGTSNAPAASKLQHVTYSELLPALLGNQVLRQFDLQPRDDSSFYHGYDINLNPGTSNAPAASKLQHVTYSELLPALLGNQVLRQFDLQPRDDSSFYHGYDINLNPGTSNAFAASVGASFYSMMPSHFFLYTQSAALKDRTVPKPDTVGSMQISETHFYPEPLYKEGTLEQVLLGMTNQNAQSMDEFITREMNNNLLEDTEESQNDGGNMDLAAWIIQQGRDHGIPGYLEWRKVCRLLPAIQNFTQLRQIMTKGAAEKIASVYKDVNDIDLFTGGLSEKPVVGGVVGPTFACILSRQFQHLKKGDRFWYENDVPPNALTKDQLQEIRKSSLTRILCDSGGKLVRLLQPSPMLMPDEYLNAFQECEKATQPMDFLKWKTASPVYEIPKETILTSLREAMRQARIRIAAEQEIFSNNIGVAHYRSAEAVHHVFLRPKRQAMLIANKSLILELASHQFMQDVQIKDHEKKPSDNDISSMMATLSSQDVEDYLQQEMKVSLPDHLEGRCRLEEEQSSLPCDHTTPFRSASGWCNNIQNPHWGKSLVTFQRLLPPRYHDGVSAARAVGRSGRALPSPRLISWTVHYDTDAPHARYALALMQWGQFLDHDLTLTPMHEALGRKPLDCKACDSPATVHPECLPIPIPVGDPFFPAVFQNSSKNCISFARSLAGQLTLGRREQMDQLTSYIDASNMYGSDACEARMLRSNHGGRLNSTKHPFGGKDLLPQDTTNVECRAPSGICFESGDIRASEQPGLTCMHTIWMREHNRIANILESLNPHWDDETIYQQARRIVSAMMQHITYSEFLPRVLGENLMKDLDLMSSTYEYDPTCDATIYNEFASAAYRFGHTLLKPMFQRLSAGYKTKTSKQSIRLRTAFFNPEALYERNAIDEVLRGLLSTSVEVFDHSITSEVTNHLFEDSKVPFSGMDLVALNLQRGRDHGLQPYNEYRALCNRTRAKSFEDLKDDIPEHIVQRLKSVYEHVDDIDLFTGGVAEKPMYGALVGPTFGCILSKQFINLRKCDRFWYETQDPFLRFTQDQLTEIRRTRLSKIFCDNSDTIDTVQLKAFDLPDDFLNPRMPCKNIPSPDLSMWKEKTSCDHQMERGRINIPMGHSHRISPCVTCSCTKEGMVCQSLKISNCFQLASTYTRETILEDDVCKVQCAFAFRAYPQFETNLDNILGFTVNEK